MALAVTTSPHTPEVVYPEGQHWLANPDGSLFIGDEVGKGLGLHAANQWLHVRTVELVTTTGAAKYPGRPVKDNPQA